MLEKSLCFRIFSLKKKETVTEQQEKDKNKSKLNRSWILISLFVVENDIEPNGTDIKRDVHRHLGGSKAFESIFKYRLDS